MVGSIVQGRIFPYALRRDHSTAVVAICLDRFRMRPKTCAVDLVEGIRKNAAILPC